MSSIKSTRRIYLLALVSLLILAIPGLAAADSGSAKETMQAAWERAAANGRYHYQADVVQTIHPTANLENVGRSAQVQYLTVTGEMDVRREAMQLEMQAGDHAPLAVKIEEGVAYGFDPVSETWTEMEGVADVFAPGGDPLGFLTAVTNVQIMEATTQSAFPANDLLPPGYTQNFSRYAFDIDGLQYARFMREQMEQQLRKQGELPPGMRLESAQIYKEMQGYGELWLDKAGRPLRQMIHLEFPPQENASEWVEAQIITEFGDWQTGAAGVFNQWQQNPQLLWNDPLSLLGISTQEVEQASLSLGLSLLAMAFVALMIIHRRSRFLYAGLSFGIISSMLVGPLLQGHQVQAFFEGQQTKQAISEQQEMAQTEQEQLQAELSGAAFNPQRNPLAKMVAAPNLAPTLAISTTNPICPLPEDTDCDDDEDDDDDGLTDWVEKHELGTDPESVDSDNDLISDEREVMGYFGNGRQWYLNPLDPDSNGDGFIDTLECPDLVDLDTNGAFMAPTGTACADTDSDGVADIFDYDNDGDGVPDRQDSSPNYVGNLTTQTQEIFELSLDGFDNTSRPLVATFEVRPTVYEHLYQTNNVVDWPDDDTAGQVMRVNDNTFADLGFTGSDMAQGDMMLVPMLEIKMPDPASNSSNPSSGLPILSSFSGDIASSPLSDWLDTGALDEYGIIVSQDEESGELYAYLPLSVIEDNAGGAPLAWGTQMLYRPEVGSFGQAHEIRLVWQVQALLDGCDTSDMPNNADFDEWCATDSGNWVSNMAVIHAYYDPFYVTGLTVQEDYGYEMAIMGQADALTVPYEADLWHIGNSLMSTFVEGKLIDDNGDAVGDRRFDINEIDGRLGAGSGTAWDVDLSNLIVDYSSYPDQVSGLRAMIETAVPELLENNYAAATNGDAVTLLIAREESFKTMSLGQLAAGDVSNSGGHLAVNVSLAAQTTQTYATLHWTPYEYDGLDWYGADIFDRLDRLRTSLQTAVSDDDITQMMSWFEATPTDIAAARIGVISMARRFYLALYNGNTNVVADSSSEFLNDEVVDDSIYSLDFNSDGLLDDPLLIHIAIGVGLLQSIIEREDNVLLDEFSDILELLGYLEAENDAEGYDTTTILVTSVGKGLKGMVKKTFKILYNGPENAVKYYKYRSKVTVTTTVMSLASAGIGIYIGLSGDANEDLILAMDIINLTTETVSAIEAAYLLYRVGKGYGDTVTTLATISKLETSTKISAAITFAFDLAIATTFFVLATRDLEPGSFAFNALLALYIAEIIVAIISLIIGSTIVGSIILAIIGLIDVLIGFICKYNGEQESEDVEKWVCGGISGIVTQILVYAIYDMALVADLEGKNRLAFAIDSPVFTRGPSSNQDGAVVGNNVTLSIDVTNTLKMGSPTGVGSSYAALLGDFFTNQNLKRSVFDYHLQDNNETDYLGTIEFGDLAWLNNQEAFTASSTFALEQAGLNKPPHEMYLTESFKVPAMECWGFYIQHCKDRVFRQVVHLNFTGQFPFDVFPQSFAEFVTMTAVDNNGYRMSWSDEFSVLWDADGDGLASQAMGGPDPNDSLPDSDGDGLSDFAEYENGTHLLLADSDSDGLSDYWELVHFTNPLLADSDGDGLLDGEEVFHPDDLYPYEANPAYPRSSAWSGGWEIVYDYAVGGVPLRTWVTADPLDTDVDGDFINDSKERVYGYNPVVPEVLNILSLDTSVAANVVAANSSLPYTATIQNELDNRLINGLLQAEFPVDSVQNTAVIDTLFPQQAVTMTGSVVAPNLSASTATSLTLRAGAIIEDPNTGRVLWLHLNESGNATSFQDDAQTLGGPHNATCSGDACATTDNGSVDFDGNDLLTVANHAELDPAAFTISLWVRRDNTNGVQTFMAKGSNGFTVGTNNNPVQATVYLDDCATPVTVSGGLLPTLNWQHVAVTYDGSSLILYYNGSERDTETAESLCHNSDDLTIGNGFKGKMDEIEIYPRAMSAAEIASLSNQPVFYLPNYASPPNLAYFAQDASQFSQSVLSCSTFATNNTVCPTDDSSIIGSGFSFAEDHAFTVAGNPILRLGSNNNSFAMAMWINPGNSYTPNNQHLNDWGQLILGNDTNGYEQAYPSLYQKGQKVLIRFGHADGQGYCEATSADVLTYNQWQFITLSFDGTNFHLYKDGTLAHSFAGANCAGEDLYAEDDFFIGHSKNPALYFTQFDNINSANNGEGFIWSDENEYDNGVGSLPLVWNSAEGVIDGGDTVAINAWAKTFGEDISFMFCDRDDPEDGIPSDCSGGNRPLAFGSTQNDPTTWEWVISHSFYNALGIKSIRYNLNGNPYKGTLHYNLYSTGFEGDLDEIQLYRNALTAEEVAEMYIGSIRSLELPFDEPPGQDIFADATSNNFEAICSGATCPDSGIPGRDNQAVRFDGVDDVLTLTSADTFGLTDHSFTVMAWVKGEAFSGDQAILGTDGGEGDLADLFLGSRNGRPYMSFGGGGNEVIGATTLQPDQWYHLAFRYNANGQHQTIYLNGGNTGDAWSGEGVRAPFVGTGVLRVGSAGGGNHFAGLIDHLVIVRKSLTFAEIQAVMNEAPLLNLHLDEDFNTSAFVDDTPFANDATCTVCPAAGAKGQMREAPIFEGSQVLEIAGANEIDNLTEQFSIMAWIRPTDVSGIHRIVAHGRTNGDNGFSFGIKEGSLIFNAWGRSNLHSTAEVLENYWQHVAVVFDDNRMAHFYVNGAYIESMTATSDLAANNDGDTFFIGGTTPINASDLSDLFAGHMDELAIYGTSLTDVEVGAIFDYQNAWYDTKMEHPILIDADDPIVMLDVYSELPLADRFISLRAVDNTTHVAEVVVTITAPDSSVTTQLATASGKAWLVAFTPTMGGEYTFDVEATDAVGNKGYVWGQVVTVDGSGPALGVTAVPVRQAITTTTFAGTASDNNSLSSSPIQINLYDHNGLSVSGVQNATLTGTNWSGDYPFPVPPYGAYQLTASGADSAGNSGTVSATVQLDGYAPFAGLYAPGGVLTETGQVLAGLLSDEMYPQQGKLLHLPFETVNGAQPLWDISPSGFAATCSNCPSTGIVGNGSWQAAAFDGVDDGLTIAANRLFNVAESTVMAWVAPGWAPGTLGYDPTLVAMADGVTTTYRIQIADDQQSLILHNDAGSQTIPVPLATPRSDGFWHHLAIAIEGDVWTAYFNGVDMGSITQTLPISQEVPLQIGSADGTSELYQGSLDEVVLYDQALSEEVIYDIAHPIATGIGDAQVRFRSLADGDQSAEEGIWHTAATSVTQNVGLWQLPVPPGTEGLYKIDLRGTDGVGNSGFTPNAWGGEIDNLAPRVTLIYSPSADYQTAQVSCAAEDFNLVESGWTCPAADATAVYEDATWYTDVFSDVQKLTGLTTSLQTLPVAANPTLTACDYFGRCTTVTPAFDILPVPMPPTLVQVDEVMEVATAVFPHYDPAHTYSTTWHWGDGATSPGTIVVSGTAVISGSHSYATGGIYSVYVEVRDDADGSLAAFSVPFTVVVNAPPTLATDNANLTVNEGTTAANSGTVLVELADTPVLTASTGTVIDNGSGSWSWSFDTMDGTDDSQTVTVYADDGRGATDSITFELIVDNVMPTATADHPSITVDEGSVATNNGTFFDPGHDVISMTASIGAVSWDAGNSGNWGWAFTTSDGPAQSQVVTMAIMDSDGAMSELDYTLTVSNVAPMIENISAPSGPVPLHAVPAINVVIAFNDPGGSSDAPYMCTFDYDNDGTVDQIVSSVGEPCNGTPTYDEPGEYTLAVSVTDKDGEATNAIYQYLVIYDPYVALGLEGVYLKQRVTVVSGDVGANTAVASGPYLAGNEEVTIGQHVTFLDANSAVRGDSVMIKQGTEVYDVYANELDNNGTIMGIYSDSVALPLTDFLPEVPVFTPGSQDFDLGQNESLTLAAGSYGQLKAKKGAVITLTGGIYNFSEWDLGQNVTVIIEAPAEIRIMGRLQIGKNGSIGPAANVTDLDASDIFIYVLGVNGNNGNLNTSPKAAQFGLNNSIYANVFVPNGTLYIRQNSEATGSFFGKWVVIGQNVTLTQDSGW